MRESSRDDDGREVFIYMAFGLLIYFGLVYVYDYFRFYINYAVVWIKTLEVYLLIPLFPELKNGINTIHTYDFASFTPEHLKEISNFTGSYFKWVCFVLLLGLSASIYWGFGLEKYRRSLSMKELLKNNVSLFPCMAPIINAAIHKEPYDSGPWRLSQTPLEFAVDNQLLLDGSNEPWDREKIFRKNGFANEKSKALNLESNSLDDEKALRILTEQLGTILPQNNEDLFESLAPYEKGLAAAFLAHGCGKKKQAFDLLDQMSLCFLDGDFENFDLDIGDGSSSSINARELWDNHHEDEFYVDAVQHHSIWKGPWFMALLEFAREKGVLPTQEFIWLRPVDRTLWYTLNQVGGRTAWSEAAGPWSHYYYEDALGESIPEPEVGDALVGLKTELYHEGWLHRIGL